MDRSRVRLYQSPGHTSMATEFPVTKQHKPLTFPQTHPPHFVFIYLFIYFQKTNKQTEKKNLHSFRTQKFVLQFKILNVIQLTRETKNQRNEVLTDEKNAVADLVCVSIKCRLCINTLIVGLLATDGPWEKKENNNVHIGTAAAAAAALSYGRRGHAGAKETHNR